MIYLVAGGGGDLERYCIDHDLSMRDLRDKSKFCVITQEHHAHGHRPKNDDEIVGLGYGPIGAVGYLRQAQDLNK